MNQYKWLPTTCAPQCYPVKLMDGAFDFNTEEPVVFIPRGNVCNNGWGEIGLINLTETELFSIPGQFDLTWFSFTENLFYKGIFNLPKEKTEELFALGFKHPDTDEPVTYEYLVTGMGPEGLVCLWAAGHGIVTELASYRAEVVKIEWERFNDNKNITRNEYIEQRIKPLLKEEDLLWLENNRKKFGLWKKYHERYNWVPVFLGNIQPVNIRINTFNGEKEFIRLAEKTLPLNRQRSMMKSIIYRWKNTDNKNFVYPTVTVSIPQPTATKETGKTEPTSTPLPPPPQGVAGRTEQNVRLLERAISGKSYYVFEPEMLAQIVAQTSNYRVDVASEAQTYRLLINQNFSNTNGLNPLYGYVLALSQSRF